MLRKTITYKDFNDNERTETFYFNLTEAEVMKMELGVKGGFKEHVQRMIDAQDTPALVEAIEYFIDKSYGVKTADGRGFEKKQTDLDAFKATEAYSKLWMELATDTAAGSAFINGIVPEHMSKPVASNVD